MLAKITRLFAAGRKWLGFLSRAAPSDYAPNLLRGDLNTKVTAGDTMRANAGHRGKINPVRKFGIWAGLEAIVVWSWNMVQDAWQWLDNLPLWADWLILTSLIVGVTVMGWPEIKQWRWVRKVMRRDSNDRETRPNIVDYMGACAIINAYIGPALRGKRPGVGITIQQDLIRRFDKVTGARLGEYEYNGELLHQWMQSNAARFLVERRGEML